MGLYMLFLTTTYDPTILIYKKPSAVTTRRITKQQTRELRKCELWAPECLRQEEVAVGPNNQMASPALTVSQGGAVEAEEPHGVEAVSLELCRAAEPLIISIKSSSKNMLAVKKCSSKHWSFSFLLPPHSPSSPPPLPIYYRRLSRKCNSE